MLEGVLSEADINDLGIDRYRARLEDRQGQDEGEEIHAQCFRALKRPLEGADYQDFFRAESRSLSARSA